MTGTWDCSNPRCVAYHVTVEHAYRDGMRVPRCFSCRAHLRLIRVRRPMPEHVRRELRERREGGEL